HPGPGRELLDRQIVTRLVLNPPSASRPGVAVLARHLCTVSLNAASAHNVTANDVTSAPGTRSHGNEPRNTDNRTPGSPRRPARRRWLPGASLADVGAGRVSREGRGRRALDARPRPARAPRELRLGAP